MNNSSVRLDRIEALVEANSRAIAENRQEISELVRASSSQRESISQLQQTTAQLVQAAQAALSMVQSNRESWQQT